MRRSAIFSLTGLRQIQPALSFVRFLTTASWRLGNVAINFAAGALLSRRTDHIFRPMLAGQHRYDLEYHEDAGRPGESRLDLSDGKLVFWINASQGSRQSCRINPSIRRNSAPLELTMTRPRRSAVPAIITS